MFWTTLYICFFVHVIVFRSTCSLQFHQLVLSFLLNMYLLISLFSGQHVVCTLFHQLVLSFLLNMCILPLLFSGQRVVYSIFHQLVLCHVLLTPRPNTSKLCLLTSVCHTVFSCIFEVYYNIYVNKMCKFHLIGFTYVNPWISVLSLYSG